MQVILTESLAPPPLGGRDGARGAEDTKYLAVRYCPEFFSHEVCFVPKILRHFGFSFGKIRSHKLSLKTFLDFLNFKPEKIRPEKFRVKNFFGFQLSTGKFFGFSNFAARKSPGFPIPVSGSYFRIYAEGVS